MMQHSDECADDPPGEDVEALPLSPKQRYAAKVLIRNWTTIPHVTHHDEADVTALEARRKDLNARAASRKRSLLAFVIAATARALRAHPRFNAVLDEDGTKLLLHKAVHMGVAIEIPDGLVVGVIRHCNRKPVDDIGDELARLSTKAREKGLTLDEMTGGTFTISSLGGIGGTGFTPIIHAPEVAILGVSSTRWTATRGQEDGIDWRLMLPLSLSYDHRVVNGADAARFTRTLAALLGDPAWLTEQG